MIANLHFYTNIPTNIRADGHADHAWAQGIDWLGQETLLRVLHSAKNLRPKLEKQGVRDGWMEKWGRFGRFWWQKMLVVPFLEAKKKPVFGECMGYCSLLVKGFSSLRPSLPKRVAGWFTSNIEKNATLVCFILLVT